MKKTINENAIVAANLRKLRNLTKAKWIKYISGEKEIIISSIRRVVDQVL